MRKCRRAALDVGHDDRHALTLAKVRASAGTSIGDAAERQPIHHMDARQCADATRPWSANFGRHAPSVQTRAGLVCFVVRRFSYLLLSTHHTHAEARPFRCALAVRRRREAGNQLSPVQRRALAVAPWGCQRHSHGRVRTAWCRPRSDGVMERDRGITAPALELLRSRCAGSRALSERRR